MAAEAPTAGPTPEDVQHEMADTRAHLTGQVNALEDKVLGYAYDATDAVAGALHSVKDAVRASAGSVQQAAKDATAFAGHALDVRHHIRRYPWLAVGCAAALGFVCGRITRQYRPGRKPT
jgi:ElaB/YqjD/DUF883 family membrane-anchored ribosome-binding protein